MLADTYKRHNLEGGKKKNNPKDHTHTHNQRPTIKFLLLTTYYYPQQTTNNYEKGKGKGRKKNHCKKKKNTEKTIQLAFTIYFLIHSLKGISSFVSLLIAYSIFSFLIQERN